MEKFIDEIIKPLILPVYPDPSLLANRLENVTADLKAFIKGQLNPLTKQLNKKSKELFVACSDIETLKERIQNLEGQVKRVRQDCASKDQQLIKQRANYQKQMGEVKQQHQTQRKSLSSNITKLNNEIEKLIQIHKDKLIEVRKELRKELQLEVEKERMRGQEALQHLRQEHMRQKAQMQAQSSKQKSKLIKKYEQKIYNLQQESQQSLKTTTQTLTTKCQEIKSIKNEIQHKLFNQISAVRHLSSQLQKQTKNHQKYKQLHQNLSLSAQQNAQKHHQTTKQLQSKIDELQKQYRLHLNESNNKIKQLQSRLQNTIFSKDKLFVDTVEQMNTERTIQVDTLRNIMMEERETAVNQVEVRAYQDSYQMAKKYQKLEEQYHQLEKMYDKVSESYIEKIKMMEEEHQLEINGINQRKVYQFSLSDQNSKRQYQNLLNKFTLEIKALKAMHVNQLELSQKRAMEEKVSLTNKLTSQYQIMLSDQRNNNQIQIKQKILQFDRKAKGYQKRLLQSQKRRSELKVLIQRNKIQSQMKIQSLIQVNQKQQQEVFDLQQRLLQMEKNKSALINQYEYQLLTVKNQKQKIKEDYELKEQQLRGNLNDRIILKNKEIARFAQKMKQQTQQLIRKNRDRIHLLEKEYEELKKVVNQKTSLPQDIQALKSFHAAYLQRETELIQERKKREELQRQLSSKDAIDKVFATKSFKRITTQSTQMQQPMANTLLQNNFLQTASKGLSQGIPSSSLPKYISQQI